MLNRIKTKIFNLMGRRITYRLGRAMYMHGRGDIPNNMLENGEMLIIRGVLAAWKQASKKRANLVIFDVGANIGDWSVELLQQLRSHEIEEHVALFSFEPVPTTASTLKYNLVDKPAYSHIEEIGLSSSIGTAEIHVSGKNAGTNSLHSDSTAQQTELVTIKLTTAAEFCESRGLEHVFLLKSDTEGHDMEVIRGALPLLIEERVSVLQFEYNHRWVYARNFLKDVFQEIELLPYKLAKLQTEYILIYESWHPELEKYFECNYVLIHRDSLRWFPTKFARFDRFNTLSTK